MIWEIEFTDEFGTWWDSLSADEQESVRASVKLLGELGPSLRFPHTSGINGSRHDHMRELRVQHAGRPYRLLFAFDPRRCAILLLGGDKTGNDRWYDENVPIADRLYDEHLELLR
ncbi:MAG: type II toxin-antitoxin system RelE/ParE family toxin [Sulfuricella sp.]